MLAFRGATTSTPSGRKQPPILPLLFFVCATHTDILVPLPHHTGTLVSLGVTFVLASGDMDGGVVDVRSALHPMAAHAPSLVA